MLIKSINAGTFVIIDIKKNVTENTIILITSVAINTNPIKSTRDATMAGMILIIKYGKMSLSWFDTR